MNITWNTDVNAPCCPGEIVSDDGRTVLVQTDWDYCGIATTFGWSIRDAQRKHFHSDGLRVQALGYCDHDGTDGTIECPECGLPASTFMNSARAWLEDHNGATADDPGYFGDDGKAVRDEIHLPAGG